MSNSDANPVAVRPSAGNSPAVPRATYRLQFNSGFTFAQAKDLVSYLADLGISHCYASPILRARPGSTHGYDIVDHNHLNPEIGSAEDFDAYVNELHRHGMGLIVDIVPNHMGVMASDNAWWLDVLENGQASPYAQFFDIDWQPLKDELQNKVLVPVLGDQYGAVLDRGELKLTFNAKAGEFSLEYYQHRFPVNPKEYPRILRHRQERLEEQFGKENLELLELQSLGAAFANLPGSEESDPEKRAERVRDKEINKRRLAALCDRSPEVLAVIEQNVSEMNGAGSRPDTFEELHELIKTQVYRLAYWRVAADDINYRRFFNINDLAGIRQEVPEVFEQTHRFTLELLKSGKINGLRVDHPDGLFNPAEYFVRLQAGLEGNAVPASGGKPVYVVIEKILTGDEKLPRSWPVYGTTGYEFANLVNGLFVSSEAEDRVTRAYRAFIDDDVHLAEIVYQCKKQVMDQALASELSVLANLLSRIALANRHTCDFTVRGLRDALTEVVACFPVYRTYVTCDQVSDTDRAYIEQATECAKQRSRLTDASVYDFIREVLLTRIAEGARPTYRKQVVRFAMKFQQFTSALMAKGLEDTAFYRYQRLVSLNEVGGDPGRFGIKPESFHLLMQEQARDWPHTMLSTSTHDSKRSEDVRARIDVISEIPLLWRRHVRRWRQMNHHLKTNHNGACLPSRNDEYLFYQSLVGAWPITAKDTQVDDEFRRRMKEFMLKAVREAKQWTSWSNTNEAYESAMQSFVDATLTPEQSAEFLRDFTSFQRIVSKFGVYNSLSQTLVKLTAPGVPDIYQGNDLWDFSLVDPDNRRPVNYSERRRALDKLRKSADANPAKFAAQLMRNLQDGQIKMYLTWRTLQARAQSAELFGDGEYVPLQVTGPKAKHILAFARCHHESIAIVAVPRLCAELVGTRGQAPLGEDVWQDTAVLLEDRFGREFQHVFSRRTLERSAAEVPKLFARDLFADFPAALLLGSGKA